MMDVVKFVVCILSVLVTLFAASAELAPISVICVDAEATGYATFQSHNQKIVANTRGIFLTYLRSRNEDFTAQEWRLMHSKDRGATFVALFQGVHATNPPVLETDSKDNLYLIHSDFVGGDAYLCRFMADQDYVNPAITVLPKGAAGKYAMAIDETRNRLYYMAHNGRFFRLDLDGNLLYDGRILVDGPNAALQYPSLCVDDSGSLFFAWTTVKHQEYLYWDIHAMKSKDQGQSWQTLAGSGISIPSVSDDTGMTTRISLDDEFISHTWLSNMLEHGGKLHFLYLARTSPARQHYVRYDIASGREDVRISPSFAGNGLRIESLDGFFASTGGDASLFCVGAYEGRIVCLVSKDNGATWRGHALSDDTFNIYAIGGCRRVTDEGDVIGTFTDFLTAETNEPHSKVFFFRIPAFFLKACADSLETEAKQGIILR